MKRDRLLLAAPKSGSGKTTITCALLHWLKENGYDVVSYKCGPDYIDPMFHKMVLGVPSRNLDTFFTGEAGTLQLFGQGQRDGSISILEGVMGLYDGLGGVGEEGSAYHLAKVTKTPILLIVDSKGMGRSLLALLSGFLQYDTDHLIKGVLLNRMSSTYYSTVKPLIEQELPIKVVGYFPEQPSLRIGSRHLGLQMPGELPHIRETIGHAAAVLGKTVSIKALLDIARSAPQLPEISAEPIRPAPPAERPVIAVARDEAFCFCYEENLDALRQAGAELRFFSPLHDKALPKQCSGLLLVGGYPELYGKALSENIEMKKAIAQAVQDGVVTVAECGGFLYLHSLLQTEDGTYPMVGVLPGKCWNTGKLVRFGYIEISERVPCFLPPGERIRGHAFHYYDSEENGDGCIATKPTTGRTYPCIVTSETCWLGFPHLYYPSNPAFPKRFVDKARAYAHQKNGQDKS